jgi:hypothetical protein
MLLAFMYLGIQVQCDQDSCTWVWTRCLSLWPLEQIVAMLQFLYGVQHITERS